MRVLKVIPDLFHASGRDFYTFWFCRSFAFPPDEAIDASQEEPVLCNLTTGRDDRHTWLHLSGINYSFRYDEIFTFLMMARVSVYRLSTCCPSSRYAAAECFIYGCGGVCLVLPLLVVRNKGPSSTAQSSRFRIQRGPSRGIASTSPASSPHRHLRRLPGSSNPAELPKAVGASAAITWPLRWPLLTIPGLWTGAGRAGTT